MTVAATSQEPGPLRRERRRFVAGLGVAQIVSWGTLYYAFPLIAVAMEADLHLSKPELYGAATFGLAVGSLAAYPVGAAIDRGHGRMILAVGSALAALLLAAWSRVESLAGFYAIFAGVGVAQAMTLYEPAFAVVALILSLAGIYAVIAHSLAQRTVEIGIRMAMGASPARVTGLLLRYGLLPSIVGMAVGCSGAFAVSRFFSAMLFGIGPLDPPTWVLVSGSMFAVACIASYLPARRACSVDPNVALRAE